MIRTGFGEPGSRLGSPRCTESLENASETSSFSPESDSRKPAMAKPTVRLIGCAMASASGSDDAGGRRRATDPQNFFRDVETQKLELLKNEKTRGTTHNDAHGPTRQTIHSTNAISGKKARARKEKRERGRWANAGEAFPRLPNHLVVTHILRSEHFDDDADLARLPAVSRAMRAAVAETGLRFKELDEERAMELGCLSAVQRLQRQGRLSRQELLCQAAARSGQLTELKALRADGCPWDRDTCSAAALGGHLQVLQWPRANGCPWDAKTCASAAEGGHLKVLLWARANGCPWDKGTCEWAAHGGHLELLQWGRANGCPCDGMEVYIAAQNGHEAMVRALIEAGADVNKAMNDAVTPLIIAAQNGHEAVVRALIEAGADVNKVWGNGVTPLLVAAHQHNEAVVRTLIEAGADVNQARDDGVTPLCIAAQDGHEAVVRALIEAGAEIDKARDDSVTPLYIAAENGHETIVRALIEAGADVNKATNNGWTPLAIATQEGHTAVVQILRDAVLVQMQHLYL